MKLYDFGRQTSLRAVLEAYHVQDALRRLPLESKIGSEQKELGTGLVNRIKKDLGLKYPYPAGGRGANFHEEEGPHGLPRPSGTRR